VVDCEDRYGFASISILIPKGSHFTETDVGEHIQRALESVIADQPYIDLISGSAPTASFSFAR
jgi:hypothetical protein